MFFFRRKEQPEDPPDVRLMKTIKFRDKDLDANRTGVLTDVQRRSIQRGQVWGAVGLWILAALFAAPPIFMATQQEWRSEPGVWLMMLGAIFCVLLAFWQQSQTKKVLLENQTASVSGPLTREMTMVYTGKVFIPVYKVTVDEKTFSVEKNVHDAFVEGEHYTLYYVPGIERLLSAELTYDPKKGKRLSVEDAQDEEMFVPEDEEQQSVSH